MVGYFGDADGDAKLTTMDVQRVARIVAGDDTAFSAWPQANRLLVADINGDGRMTAIDSSYLLQKVRGLPRPEIPDIPLDITINLGGPDPLVDIPTTLAGRVGEIVTVPVRLDNTEYLEGVEFQLAYDPAVLQLLKVRRGSVTADFDFYVQQLTDGSVRIDTARMQALGAGSGSLLELDFRIKAAPTATTMIDLQSARLNAGRLTLTFEPQIGDDPTDGRIALSARLDRKEAGVEPKRFVPELPLPNPDGVAHSAVDWSARYDGFTLQPLDRGSAKTEDWKKAPWAKDLAARIGDLRTGLDQEGSEGVAPRLLNKALRGLPRLWR